MSILNIREKKKKKKKKLECGGNNHTFVAVFASSIVLKGLKFTEI